MQDPEVVKLDTDKLAGWMEKGAKPTGTVKTLINKYKPAPVESA
jgi:ribosomal protein S16